MNIEIESYDYFRKFKKKLIIPDVCYEYGDISATEPDLISKIVFEYSELHFEVESFKNYPENSAVECSIVKLSEFDVFEILKRLEKISFNPFSALGHFNIRGVCDHFSVEIKISSKDFDLKISSNNKACKRCWDEVNDFLNYIDFIIRKNIPKIAETEILELVGELFEGEISDDNKLSYINSAIKEKLLKSDLLRQLAVNSKKNSFLFSPDLDNEILIAVMEALVTYPMMSTQVLKSERVRSGLKAILLGPVQLYEALLAPLE